jgi:hypothetical protein
LVGVGASMREFENSRSCFKPARYDPAGKLLDERFTGENAGVWQIFCHFLKLLTRMPADVVNRVRIYKVLVRRGIWY